MTDEFKKDFAFRDVIEVLDKATKRDKVIFHIAGVGGEVDTVLLVINHVKTTAAHTVMIVEAPSYSGHAYLALSGDELFMTPYSYLMMHTSSGYGYNCDQEQGTDRGETKAATCHIMLDAHLYNTNKVIMDMKYLTYQEKQDIINGKTVILRWN